jgi:hypothetical protein
VTPVFSRVDHDHEGQREKARKGKKILREARFFRSTTSATRKEKNPILEN